MGLDSSKDLNPNAAKGYILEKFTKHKDGINCMLLNPETNLLATGGEDMNIKLWKVNTSPTQLKGVLRGHTEYVICLAFHDKFLVSGSADKTVRKWCLTTYETLFVYEGHQDRISRVLCAGDFMFSTSADKTIRVWTMMTHEDMKMHDVNIRNLEGHKKAVFSVVFIPSEDSPLDGKTLKTKDTVITGSSDHTAIIWSLKAGKPIYHLKAHKGTVNALVVDPEGKVLFTGGGDGLICSWDIATGTCKKKMLGHEGAIISMIGHNKMLYSCSADQTARAWIMEFGECIKVYRGHTHTVTCIKYHDGYIYTGCSDQNARMFKARTGECKRTFKGHTRAIVQLEVVHDRLYTGAADGSMRVWDTTGILDEDISADDDGSDRVETFRAQRNSIV